jgi:UDP-GlcNAc3NAcA epimerase
MSTRKKILTIVGARPQFVKAAALSPSLARYPMVEEVLVHTGQHFDETMSDVFFRELPIPKPRYNLGIGGGTHGQNTGRMIEALEDVMLSERPEAVVVYGDTDSTLAAAVSAAKLGILLAHVEAGLRSYRRAMPEEINRVVTDHVADILYTPSANSAANLCMEGIAADRIVVTGDVMQDVVRLFAPIARNRSQVLARLGIQSDAYYLLTMHRKENTDHEHVLRDIIAGLSSSEVPVIFPVHPRTKKMLAEFGLALPACVRAIEPQGYLDTLRLIADASLVLTDSGGVQKEAYFLGRPCVTLRDETEWVELVSSGANTLVGSNSARIKALLRHVPSPPTTDGLFGDGHAADRIATDLVARMTM